MRNYHFPFIEPPQNKPLTEAPEYGRVIDIEFNRDKLLEVYTKNNNFYEFVFYMDLTEIDRDTITYSTKGVWYNNKPAYIGRDNTYYLIKQKD
jgi:hypothetical protein